MPLAKELNNNNINKTNALRELLFPYRPTVVYCCTYQIFFFIYLIKMRKKIMGK